MTKVREFCRCNKFSISWFLGCPNGIVLGGSHLVCFYSLISSYIVSIWSEKLLLTWRKQQPSWRSPHEKNYQDSRNVSHLLGQESSHFLAASKIPPSYRHKEMSSSNNLNKFGCKFFPSQAFSWEENLANCFHSSVTLRGGTN